MMTRDCFSRPLQLLMVALALIVTLGTGTASAERRPLALMPVTCSDYDYEYVGSIMDEELTAALYDSGAFTVLERQRLANSMREAGLGMSGAVSADTAVKTGRLIGAKFSMLANVSMVALEENPTSQFLGALVRGSDRYMSKLVGRVAVEYQIIDNETGEIIVSDSADGRKTAASPEAAIRQACADVADKIMVQLRDMNPMVASVLDVSGDTLYIDKGKHDGIHIGDKLRVSLEGDPIVKGGRIIAVKETVLGEVKVEELHDDYAICRITSGEGRIVKGAVVKHKPRKK